MLDQSYAVLHRKKIVMRLLFNIKVLKVLQMVTFMPKTVSILNPTMCIRYGKHYKNINFIYFKF